MRPKCPVKFETYFCTVLHEMWSEDGLLIRLQWQGMAIILKKSLHFLTGTFSILIILYFNLKKEKITFLSAVSISFTDWESHWKLDLLNSKELVHLSGLHFLLHTLKQSSKACCVWKSPTTTLVFVLFCVNEEAMAADILLSAKKLICC